MIINNGIITIEDHQPAQQLSGDDGYEIRKGVRIPPEFAQPQPTFTGRQLPPLPTEKTTISQQGMGDTPRNFSPPQPPLSPIKPTSSRPELLSYNLRSGMRRSQSLPALPPETQPEGQSTATRRRILPAALPARPASAPERASGSSLNRLDLDKGPSHE